ncbi:MAG: hypothetical protein IT450_23330 [Phycisphaerales bacterium]|nr:hypothetical protein [Phycisphaerales bacterium]
MSTSFDLWLEFENWIADPDYDPEVDFANVIVTLPDRRRYALNVWTFKFLDRARYPWPHNFTNDPQAEYLIAPDLFVARLDRALIERAVSDLLANGQMRADWLCADDGEECC